MRGFKTIISAGFLASALALAGCGGGSDSDDMMSGPTAEETAAMEAAQNAVQDAIAAAQALAINTEATADEVSTVANQIMTARSMVGDLPEAEQGSATANLDLAQGVVNIHEERLLQAAAAEEAQDELDDIEEANNKKAAEEAQEALTAKAKELSKAIAAVQALSPAPTVSATSIGQIDLGGGNNSDVITLKKDSDAVVMALGNWMGTKYVGSAGTGDTSSTGETRVYSNAEDPDSVPFIGPAGEAIHGLTATTAEDDGNAYGLTAGAHAGIGTGDQSPFPKTGTTTYKGDDRKFAGTFMSAPGTYECTGSAACTAGPNSDGAIVLAGVWTFTPDSGAMLSVADKTYLQFGWWLRKDGDGPSHAGAFTRATGVTAVDSTAINGVNRTSTTVTATYTGSAAGKFAVSDPLRPMEDNAGHFTANAKLTAEFSAATMLSGTIDKFRLNDGNDDPGWTVSLQKAGHTSDAFGTAATATAQTVWSIGEAKGMKSGEWSAQMYEDVGDDNTTPDSVIGTFESSFGAHVGSRNTHSMVGAFGAGLDN